MTDFSMANMDYTPVKFIIKCFEANYPESLGTVLVYKAPWVFGAIWKVISGWLDPVVAGKVHFAKTVDELAKFVPRSHIPADLDGDEAWKYEYVEPVAGENDRMLDVQQHALLLAERDALVARYEDAVREWIADRAESKGLEERRRQRDEAAEALRAHYWRLDPFVRARTLYDRMGIIGEGGKMEFYPERAQPQPVTAAAKAVETSAEDLD